MLVKFIWEVFVTMFYILLCCDLFGRDRKTCDLINNDLLRSVSVLRLRVVHCDPCPPSALI